MSIFNEITFKNIKTQIENFLKREHFKANILYSSGSPYGQILSVLENLYQLSILYLKNAISQFDLGSNTATNTRIVRNSAILAGHIPSRSISATGTLKLSIKSNAEIETDIPGGRITLFNRGTIRNKTNNLDYSLSLGSDQQTYKVTTNSQMYIPIIQGKWEKRQLTGSGEMNQTYQVTIRGNVKDIENFNVEVTVDGKFWSVKKHIYELLPDEEACVVRTGFDGGIDIIFGNSGYGKMPDIGSLIEVNYLLTDGANGSIFRRTPNDWSFITEIIDGWGNPVDISKVFDISIYTDINFGANGEDVNFTRNILPITSTNFVLGTPQQYAYQIKKLGIFSHVNAYEENNQIYIVATPNIKLFKSQNSDYFSVSKEAFVLDKYEKSKIDKYLKISGNLMLTRRYEINSPKLSYYIMNIFIMIYSDAIESSVNTQIYDKISEYFLNLNRTSRIPKVDLIKEISSISDIHSVDISFMCKKNEDYHREAALRDENRRNEFATKQSLELELPNPDYNPDAMLGLDPILGDIIFESDEIPIIRGGWVDRRSIYFSDNIDDPGLKSVNIIYKGKINTKNRPKI